MPASPPDLDPEHHWVVPFAAVGQLDQRIAPPPLPHLQALLPLLREGARDSGAATSFVAPHERALARSAGLPAGDGQWPGAALAGEAPHEPQAWMHPVHLQVGMDQVQLQPAELFGLDAAQARALFDALAPLCAEDGVVLSFEQPTRWRASGERLRGLQCASLDRVAGRSVAAWLPGGEASRWLQRLMSEAQMLFYTHAVNDTREAARQLPVNGVWVDGAGALPPGHVPRALPQVVDALRQPALRGDAAAWRAAWQHLDDTLMRELLERRQRGQALALTLCGERDALTLTPHAPSTWQGIARALGLRRATPVTELLNTL